MIEHCLTFTDVVKMISEALILALCVGGALGVIVGLNIAGGRDDN